MRTSFLLLCLLVASACSQKSTIAPTPVDRQLVLAPGESVVLQEASVSIRFDKVTADSRCPADAFCPWEGDAVVRLQVSDVGDGSQWYDLHTAAGLDGTARHGSGSIAMVRLLPYPYSNKPIQPGDYRVTLRFTR